MACRCAKALMREQGVALELGMKQGRGRIARLVCQAGIRFMKNVLLLLARLRKAGARHAAGPLPCLRPAIRPE
jgi:hypothetical protein